MVVVDAADMGDHDGLVVLLHPIEHLGLAREVPDALPRQLRIGRVEEHVLRRVEGQADIVGPCLGPEGSQFRVAFGDHAVELRHVGMGGVGRDVRRKAVHVEPLGPEVVQHLVEKLERALEVGALLPSARVLRPQSRLPHDLHGKAEAQRSIGRGHADTWA